MQKEAKKILIIVAHPSLHRSENNLPLVEVAKAMPNVTVVDLYHHYPKFNIDVETEQQHLLKHDIIIFQFPLYWYSTPALLKEWQDVVLETGFAYGLNGHALKDKVFFCSITAGGRKEAYQSDGYNHVTIRELMYPLEQMASLTNMQYIPPFVLFGAKKAHDEQRFQHHLTRWKQLLTALIEDRVDIEEAKKQTKLNHCFNFINKEE